MAAGRVVAPSLEEILRSHEEHITRDAERALADPTPWIYVGSGAPAPAFQNGYTNVGGSKVPLRYRFLRPYDPARLSDRSGGPQVAVEIQGKVTGGTPGATVFTILVPGQMPDGSAAWTTYTLDYDVELSGGFTALTTGDVVLTPSGSGGGCGPRIYVGTPAQTAGQVDNLGRSVSDLVLANPAPFNSPPYVPFESGNNNTLGDDPPCNFWSFQCMVFFEGGFAGGPDDGTSPVWTFPAGYRPPFRLPFNASYNDWSDIAELAVLASGDLVFFGGF